MTAFTIMAWPLLALSVAGVVYWFAVVVRAGRVLADRPTVRRGLELPAPEAGWPKLSIIVPVHNEQRVIDAGEVYTLGALARLYLAAQVHPDQARELAEKNLKYKRDAQARDSLAAARR